LTEWWLVVIIFQALAEHIEKAFTSMQGMKTQVCEQRQLLRALKHDIKAHCNIKCPLTNKETISSSKSIKNDFQETLFLVCNIKGSGSRKSFRM